MRYDGAALFYRDEPFSRGQRRSFAAAGLGLLAIPLTIVLLRAGNPEAAGLPALAGLTGQILFAAPALLALLLLVAARTGPTELRLDPASRRASLAMERPFGTRRIEVPFQEVPFPELYRLPAADGPDRHVIRLTLRGHRLDLAIEGAGPLSPRENAEHWAREIGGMLSGTKRQNCRDKAPRRAAAPLRTRASA